MVLLAPIAATIIQLGDLAPARVLGGRHGRPHRGQLERARRRAGAPRGGREGDADAGQPAAEPLYIVKPFSGGGVAALFSTHPPIEERVRRLREMGV